VRVYPQFPWIHNADVAHSRDVSHRAYRGIVRRDMKIAVRAHREYEGTGGKLGYDVGLRTGGLAQRKGGLRVELQLQSGTMDAHETARLGGEPVPFIDRAALGSDSFTYAGALGMREDA